MNNLEKIAGAVDFLKKSITEPAGNMGPSHIREIASLGALAVPTAYNAVGDEKKKMGRKTTAALEVGGLGALAAPYAYKLMKGH